MLLFLASNTGGVMKIGADLAAMQLTKSALKCLFLALNTDRVIKIGANIDATM